VKNPLSIEELTELAKRGGLFPVQGLLNKRSKSYKEFGKELEESDELAVASFLMLNPKAVIRPLVTGSNKLRLGYKPDVYFDL